MVGILCEIRGLGTTAESWWLSFQGSELSTWLDQVATICDGEEV